MGRSGVGHLLLDLVGEGPRRASMPVTEPDRYDTVRVGHETALAHGCHARAWPRHVALGGKLPARRGAQGQ